MEGYTTPKEIAANLHTPVRFVYALIHAGVLPHIKGKQARYYIPQDEPAIQNYGAFEALYERTRGLPGGPYRTTNTVWVAPDYTPEESVFLHLIPAAKGLRHSEWKIYSVKEYTDEGCPLEGRLPELDLIIEHIERAKILLDGILKDIPDSVRVSACSKEGHWEWEEGEPNESVDE